MTYSVNTHSVDTHKRHDTKPTEGHNVTTAAAYDPDVGRPRKPPEDRYRTPAKSFKPWPPENWPAGHAKAARVTEANPAKGKLTLTDVLNHALEEFLSDDWKDWR